MENPHSLPDFSDVHVVVIGDIMIDRYVQGTVRRISPEAPVPVVEGATITQHLGGAGNVALNLHALGARVTLLSVCGEDSEADVLSAMLAEYRGIDARIQRLEGRKTTVKTRIMAASQHLLRIDSEDTSDIPEMAVKKVLHTLAAMPVIHAIIFQDYNKGMLTSQLIREVMALATSARIPTFVDPKEKNFSSFAGCTLLKPNKKELFQAAGQLDTDLQAAASAVYTALQPDILMVTLGSQGIFVQQGEHTHIYPTSKRIIADVCGAGDTVISMACLAYVKGFPVEEIARMSNAAGGQVCEKPGVVPVDRDQLQKEIYA